MQSYKLPRFRLDCQVLEMSDDISLNSLIHQLVFVNVVLYKKKQYHLSHSIPLIPSYINGHQLSISWTNDSSTPNRFFVVELRGDRRIEQHHRTEKRY